MGVIAVTASTRYFASNRDSRKYMASNLLAASSATGLLRMSIIALVLRRILIGTSAGRK
jgi:hypothetical protein